LLPAPRSTRAPERSRPQLPESFQRARHHRFVSFRLDRRAEELDVPPPLVPGLDQRATDAAKGNVAVPDHDAFARGQRADLEIAHLHDGDAVPAVTHVAVQTAPAPRAAP